MFRVASNIVHNLNILFVNSPFCVARFCSNKNTCFIASLLICTTELITIKIALVLTTNRLTDTNVSDLSSSQSLLDKSETLQAEQHT